MADLELPRLADTLVEGTVSRWLKRPGEPVRRGEALVEIETDKVNTELESPADGVLSEVLVAEGETVPVGRVLARIAGPASGAEAEAASTPSAAAQPTDRSRRLAEHLRASAAAVPQGACVREVPAEALDRLPGAAAAVGDLNPRVLPQSRSHLAMPPLDEGESALLVPGAARDGISLLSLCYDRRRLDDWQADQLLKRIAEELTRIPPPPVGPPVGGVPA